ncbi:MAG: hypothetical protein GVY26_20715 [Bacteroidetes bacterium]|nr:hypothetical protein [Bacteroidota bacterium]
MSEKYFYLQLIAVTLLAAAAVYLINTLPQLQAHRIVGWISLGLFFFITILMFHFGRQAALSDNKHTFTNVFLGFTTGKIFLIILFVFGYSRMTEPETKFFILPFFSMYLIYTIFETYVMMKLGRIKN